MLLMNLGGQQKQPRYRLCNQTIPFELLLQCLSLDSPLIPSITERRSIEDFIKFTLGSFLLIMNKIVIIITTPIIFFATFFITIICFFFVFNSFTGFACIVVLLFIVIVILNAFCSCEICTFVYSSYIEAGFTQTSILTA